MEGLGSAGGFIQKGESLDDCVRRELKEETGIEVPYLQHYGNYSDPGRERGQIISVAFVAVHPSGKLKLRAILMLLMWAGLMYVTYLRCI